MTIDSLLFQFSNRLGPGKLIIDRKLYEGEAVCHDPDWCVTEKFFLEQTPRLEYRFFSKKCIPGSVGKNYFVQTEILEDYLCGDVYRGLNLPPAYADAVQEFRSRKKELKQMIKFVDWDVCAHHYVSLKLNRYFRPTPIEVVYCAVAYGVLNKKHIFTNAMHATAVRPSYGNIVSIGMFDFDGALVEHRKPSFKDPALGVLFSRPADPDAMTLNV